MKLGLRASKSEENEKKLQKAIKAEADLILEQKIAECDSKLSSLKKERAEMEQKFKEEVHEVVKSAKVELEDLYRIANDNTGSTFRSNDNQTRLIAEAFSAYSRVMVSSVEQKLGSCKENCERVAKQVKLADESFSKASKAYDSAEAAKASAQKKADDAKNNIPPPEVERFVETSGAVLLRDGSKVLDDIVAKLMPLGGVIFIDEAHQLFPNMTSSNEGMSVVHRLLKIAWDSRSVITFILSGYKEGIEFLLSTDEGLPRRFVYTFNFPNYTAIELQYIFEKMLTDKKLKLERDVLSAVVGRRFARNANSRGFGNAGDLLNYITLVQERNFQRRQAEFYRTGTQNTDCHTITSHDILGPQPDPQTCAAYKKLDAMIGLKSVKKNVKALIGRLQDMWVSEYKGEAPKSVPMLNRLFVGSPGNNIYFCFHHTYYLYILKELVRLAQLLYMLRYWQS